MKCVNRLEAPFHFFEFVVMWKHKALVLTKNTLKKKLDFFIDMIKNMLKRMKNINMLIS